MTIRTLLAAMCLLAGGTAAAQPGSAEPPVEAQPPQPPQPPQPQPDPPQPPRPPLPPRPMIEEPAPAPPTPAPMRPTGFSLGIGIGYRFPSPTQMPNVTSVRLRLDGGITFEPTLVLATNSHSVDVGQAATATATELGAAVLARFPIVRHRRTDLEILGGVDIDNLKEDPDNLNTDDVSSTTTTTVRYGVAVGAWITPQVQASLSATNGLVTFTKTRQEMGFDSVVVTNDTTFGLTFDPTVVLMFHLYN